MNPQVLSRFLELLATRTGLHVRDKDRPEVARAIESRYQALHLENLDAYFKLLERESDTQSGEWKRLLPRLTNGESYFLRDKGQFSLLKDQILPELIARQRFSRSLRIWSAGCSTGEEPYSLAMMVDELLPQSEGWNILILGTDINDEALEKARNGVYGEWAFRSVEQEVRSRYFERSSQGYLVNKRLKNLVTFGHCNLRGDEFSRQNPQLAEMDLILCRNVLIYFRPDAIAVAVRGFAKTLRDGGYLLTGHAELANQSPAPLLVRSFAQSVAYQRWDDQRRDEQKQGAPSLEALKIVTSPLPVASRPPVRLEPIGLPKPASSPFLSVPHVAVPSMSPALPTSATGPTGGESVEALCGAARDHANLGRYDEAVKCCREAIVLDVVGSTAYFIWAQVSGEQGDVKGAKELLKKVIYLAPGHFDAYLELASIYEDESDAVRARRMREVALDLLQGLPANSELENHPGARASELTGHVRDLLGFEPSEGPSGAPSLKLGGRP